jgi:tRNA G18 (ribose-2'-O)-methylase SpoU
VRQAVLIEDADDPRIAAYRQVRERDLVGRSAGFIAEGEVVLRACVRSGRWPLASVLLARKRLEALADLIAALPADTAVYSADQSVLDAVVGFHIHRGILGHGLRPSEPRAEDLLAGVGHRALVVVLFGIGNHDNMGGVFRNAAAFGADAVVLDSGCCDPLYRKAIRVSVGASLIVPFARMEAGADAIALLRAAGLTPVALSPSGQTPLHQFEPPARAALLLGAEGPGLSDEILARSRTVAIPMAGAFDSLNVATTSGIALHRLVFG